jgi:hypothetical protein
VLPFGCGYALPDLQPGQYNVIVQAFQSGGEGTVNLTLTGIQETVREICDNGVDDDGDGRVDAPVDIGCGGATATREDPACADGVDNDGDGHIDFDGGRWLAGTALTAPDASCGSRPSTTSENAGSGCGLGFELVPALALLSALRRRRRRG